MTSVRWSPENGKGIEHLDLDTREPTIVVESVLIGERTECDHGFIYRIECDAQWRVTRVIIKRAGGVTLELLADTHGNWSDGNGRPHDDLKGCIDIDISATPFTNTLPIRRLNLGKNERRVIPVVYIALPAMTTKRVEQAYTCIEPDRLYRYEGITTQYTADLPVDGDGLVIDYPGLFRRLVD
jgi:hypothetical protein